MKSKSLIKMMQSVFGGLVIGLMYLLITREAGGNITIAVSMLASLIIYGYVDILDIITRKNG
jgi:hypothetical protein